MEHLLIVVYCKDLFVLFVILHYNMSISVDKNNLYQMTFMGKIMANLWIKLTIR